MVPSISRRSLLTGVVGAVGAGGLGVSGYNWYKYSSLHSSRNHLRFRRLRGRNRSDEPATLTVTVRDDGSHFHDQTYDLEASGDEADGDEKPLNGPWIKSAGEYSIHVELEDEELVLEHAEIVDRLDEMSCQGSDDAEVTIIVTEERTFESAVADAE